MYKDYQRTIGAGAKPKEGDSSTLLPMGLGLVGQPNSNHTDATAQGLATSSGSELLADEAMINSLLQSGDGGKQPEVQTNPMNSLPLPKAVGPGSRVSGLGAVPQVLENSLRAEYGKQQYTVSPLASPTYTLSPNHHRRGSNSHLDITPAHNRLNSPGRGLSPGGGFARSPRNKGNNRVATSLDEKFSKLLGDESAATNSNDRGRARKADPGTRDSLDSSMDGEISVLPHTNGNSRYKVTDGTGNGRNPIEVCKQTPHLTLDQISSMCNISLGRAGWAKLSSKMSSTMMKKEMILNRAMFGVVVKKPGRHHPSTFMREVGGVGSLVQTLRLRRWVILPDNGKRKYWDILQLFILLFLAFSIPLRIGFNITAMGGWFVLELLFDLYFFCDMFVNILSAYYDENNDLVTQPRLLAIKYLKGWFVLDLIALLPIDYIQRGADGMFLCSITNPGGADCIVGASSTGSYLKMVRMLRLVKLFKLVRLLKFGSLMERYQDEMLEVLWLLSIIKLAAMMIFFAHLNACLFYSFSGDEWMTAYELQRVEDGALTPWLLSNFGESPDAVPLKNRYMGALYWAFATVTTVGYGDIAGATIAERVWCCVTMVFGTFFFSFLFGSMVQELETAFLAKVTFNNKMIQVRTYVKDKNMNKATRLKVLSYFRGQNIKSYSERNLLLEMPFELRNDILTQLYADVIDSVPLFQMTQDEVFVTELISRVAPMSLAKGCFLYRTGEAAKELYILAEGQVEVTDSQGRRVVIVFAKGTYFGEGACFGDLRRLESIRCRTNCQLLALDFKDMEPIMEMFPTVREAMGQVYYKRKDEFSVAIMEAEKKFDLQQNKGPQQGIHRNRSMSRSKVFETDKDMRRLSVSRGSLSSVGESSGLPRLPPDMRRSAGEPSTAEVSRQYDNLETSISQLSLTIASMSERVWQLEKKQEERVQAVKREQSESSEQLRAELRELKQLIKQITPAGGTG